MKKVFLIVLLLCVAAFTGNGSAGVWDQPAGNVYWGDFHIHTEYSVDAVMGGLSGGRFAREAGMYAMYCSKLDFYSVTDHAEMLSKKEYWPETIKAAQDFNAIGASRPDSIGDPSIVAFTGWEWTQSGPYGHKNVIMKWDDPKKLPPSPLRAFAGIQGLPEDALELNGHISTISNIKVADLYRGYKWGQADLTYLAPYPHVLFEKLHKYCLDAGIGCDAVVIPHGNAWGQAPPMYTSWALQLNAKDQDPQIQRLIEVYSKHGNSEEYRDFPPDYRYYRNGAEETEESCSVPEKAGGLRGLLVSTVGKGASAPDVKSRAFRDPKPGCEKVCQEPNESYIPCCRQAGEIVKQRCVNPESEFCKAQVALARRTSTPFPKHIPLWKHDELKPEFRSDPGKTEAIEWGTCGQCRDCYQPAFNYITDGSAQKALASAYFDPDGTPHYYRFGFIGSTDTHKTWGGSVKETKELIEVQTALAAQTGQLNPDTPGWERAVNFINPGSLVAVISPHRSRENLWDAVKARRVYSTSGPRIEVWARAELKSNGADVVTDMGSESTSSANPMFSIRVNGAFEEQSNCPYDDEPLIKSHLQPDEFTRVCLNQCYRITDKRIPIARIEVVKILQPLTPDENKMKPLRRGKENPKGLIIDPYYVANVSGAAVEWSWTDKEFENEPKGRSVAYYFRIIQEPTEGYNCNPTYLIESGKSCNAKNPDPLEIEKKINPQDGSKPAALSSIKDACYTDVNDPKTYCEERAWTSPFYIVRE